ncbi:tRNA pseudouridine(38-40) synthase TruA [Oceanihabitans sp. 2_MG-2023]|uniref:tRNA pseudouridine synthase A n=1 Tax=Oceanihabitans sp. 2_MG-2023 TaxID=3062661 RepID=UPI0026E14801|nr:tRNA pseudouridine(38-40) synthase TruA [Oceanihabitans sp. 2_MG-2023]MDO6596738.1 tRNA pseudouridine(38-40) synthase TruA [Oceanihabitans sp. 2_MG-2023]
MFNKRYYYLIKVQYLGYRFHGWQKQPNLKTVHLMIDRTFKFILNGAKFKTLASGRTDAMVSANASAFELFLYEPIEDLDAFLALFNHNLPQDIRALAIEEVDAKFNIIQHSKIKEYLYLFTHSEKCHPFCAPILTTILEELDIEIMKEGAKLFQGTHNFKTYCYRATEEGLYTREITTCELVENTIFSANFFPEKTFMLRVKGKGFGRNQIRLMMGALIKLGRGDITLAYIKNTLLPESTEVMDYIAPASGLVLNNIEFE